MAFIVLNNQAQLDEFLATSNGVPAILFKHSDVCGISARAYREMAALNRRVGLITVQKSRGLSNEIEHRFNLPHETPQVLIVQNNKLVWDTSHGRVRASVIEEALQSVSSKHLQ